MCTYPAILNNEFHSRSLNDNVENLACSTVDEKAHLNKNKAVCHVLHWWRKMHTLKKEWFAVCSTAEDKSTLKKQGGLLCASLMKKKTHFKNKVVSTDEEKSTKQSGLPCAPLMKKKHT